MTMEIFYIFHFLKYCLGKEVDMSELVAKMDWRQLYDFAKKQALIGFCFQGIERLGNEYPEELRKNPVGQDLQCSNVVGLPDGAGEIAVPTTAFNAIYQLCHMYHHFFDEGIGMRQIIDYYFVVDKWHADRTELTDIAALQRELKHLGLFKFAGAVMYVLHEVLGLSEEKMMVPMDEKRGSLLLSEILNGGNFGKHFSKYGHFTQQGMAKKYFLKIWRNMHFVRYYPAEALSEPIFRTWHFLWRMRQK